MIVFFPVNIPRNCIIVSPGLITENHLCLILEGILESDLIFSLKKLVPNLFLTTRSCFRKQ